MNVKGVHDDDSKDEGGSVQSGISDKEDYPHDELPELLEDIYRGGFMDDELEDLGSGQVRCCAEWFGSAVSSEFQSCSGVLSSSFGSVLLLCLGLPGFSAGLGLALQSLVSAGREELCS
ncbi:hypothetical protein AAC387_Pa03g4288 [Persea americana]